MPEDGKESRREALEKVGIDEPQMPDCDAAYLVGYLFEIGPSGVTHEAIAAWKGNTGIELNAWEARMVRRLSQEYVGESQKATALERPCPWESAPYAHLADYLKGMRVKNSVRRLAAL